MDYATASKNALKAIRASGLVLTMKRLKPDPTYDPVVGAPVVPEGGEPIAEEDRWDTWQVAGVVLPATSNKLSGFENRVAELDKLVISRVRYLIISAVTTAGVACAEPMPEDQLTLEGEDWRVVGCTRLAPAGVAIIYKIGVVL